MAYNELKIFYLCVCARACGRGHACMCTCTMLKIKPGTLNMLGKCLITELYSRIFQHSGCLIYPGHSPLRQTVYVLILPMRKAKGELKVLVNRHTVNKL